MSSWRWRSSRVSGLPGRLLLLGRTNTTPSDHTVRWVIGPRPGSPPRVRLAPRPRPPLQPHTRSGGRQPVPKPSYRLVQEIRPGQLVGVCGCNARRSGEVLRGCHRSLGPRATPSPRSAATTVRIPFSEVCCCFPIEQISCPSSVQCLSWLPIRLGRIPADGSREPAGVGNQFYQIGDGDLLAAPRLIEVGSSIRSAPRMIPSAASST